MLKIYIITTPCSGKSIITQKYSGSIDHVTLIDQDNISSGLVSTGIISPEAPENEKANAILEYLETRQEPSIVLGSYIPGNLLDYPEITIVCVILPAFRQFYFVTKRRVRYALYRLLRFLPSYRDFEPDKRWSKWSNILKRRKAIATFANINELPVYGNLNIAVHRLIQG